MDRPLILELANRQGVKPERAHAENILVQCPMVGDTDYHPLSDKGSLTFSVKVEPFKQSPAHCFRCHLGGSVTWCYEQAQTHFNGGFEDVLEWLREADRGGFASALTAARCHWVDDRDRVEGPKAEERKKWDRYASECHRRGLHPYALERGIIRADYERWKLGYDPETDRTIFPVWDEGGRLVGVGRRACDNNKVCKTYPRFHDIPKGRWKAEVFYGEHRIDPTVEHVRLVEGYMGTVIASRYLTNVLGVLGSGTNIEGTRLEKLRSWAKTVTLLYDGDQAGHDAVYGWEDVRGVWHPGLRDVLRPYVAVRVGTLPFGKDPDTVTPAELVRADREAKSIVFDYQRTSGYSPPPLPS